MTEEAKQPAIFSMQVGARGLEPKTFDDVYRLAKLFAAGGWAPMAYREDLTEEEKKAGIKQASKPFSVDKIASGIVHGLEVGFTPAAALQSIALINGTPTIWGDGALGLIQNSKLLEDHKEELFKDDKGKPLYARVMMKRIGIESPMVIDFGLVEAGKAGLLTKPGPWMQYDGRMMTMRSRAWVMRGLFADVLRGLHIREEIEDIDPEPTKTVEMPMRMSDAKPSTMVVGSIGSNPPLSTPASNNPITIVAVADTSTEESELIIDAKPVDQPAQASLPVADKPAAATTTDTLTQAHRRILMATAKAAGLDLDKVEAKFGKLTEALDSRFAEIKTAINNWE